MEKPSNSPHSENHPEWFAKVNDDLESKETTPQESSRKSSFKRNRVIPIVAVLAIVGAAAAYGITQKSNSSSGIDDTLVNQQSASNQNNNLPAPTVTGGPQGGPGQGVDPDGDNWTGANRHRDGKFDPNHPFPPHGDDNGVGNDDGPNGDH